VVSARGVPQPVAAARHRATILRAQRFRRVLVGVQGLQKDGIMNWSVGQHCSPGRWCGGLGTKWQG
jgi:hypothetical protein